jgi:pteridine reductase
MMTDLPLTGQTVLITGGARRVGRLLSLAAARAGANIILHHNASNQAAADTAQEISDLGRIVTILQADFHHPDQAEALIEKAWAVTPFSVLVNNAAIFEPLTWDTTTLMNWQAHLDINLTTPFFLSQAFARRLPGDQTGRIINLLDWRALRPVADHFPYTISKAGLVALTKSLAVALAPRITVNGLALGAVLPPADGEVSDAFLKPVPAKRWALREELEQTFLFMLTSPAYITGEIIHLDGGRHLI